MDILIKRGGEILERIRWVGEPWVCGDKGAEQRREQLYAESVARAWELGGLPYEERNPRWLEPLMRVFSCREIDANTLEIATPVGALLLAARRARAGEMTSEVTVAARSGIIGQGSLAREEQDSPPVKIAGYLREDRAAPTFAPSHIEYADGTRSGFLGLYPRAVVAA